jgi:hypothetical protein
LELPAQSRTRFFDSEKKFKNTAIGGASNSEILKKKMKKKCMVIKESKYPPIIDLLHINN